MSRVTKINKAKTSESVGANDALLKTLAEGLNSLNNNIQTLVDGQQLLTRRLDNLEKDDEKKGYTGFTMPERERKKDTIPQANEVPLGGMDAKDHPSGVRRDIYESQEAQIGQPHDPRQLNPTGPAETSLLVRENTVIPVKHISKEKAEMERFMQDILTVVVHKTGDETADPLPCVTVNGVNQYFIRGREQQVKRMFVGRLAECKVSTFGNVKTQNAMGDDTYEYPETQAPIFQFAVIHDPAGARGKAWLDAKLAADQ